MLALEKEKKEYVKIDTVQPGYGQYENDELHNMTEHGTGSVGTTQGGTSRYAKEGGSFSYTMLVKPEGTDLLVTFRKTDAGKGIKITAENITIYEAVPEANQDNREDSLYYDVLIPIPEEAMKLAGKRFYDSSEKTILTFTIQGIDGKESAAVCQFLHTVERN